MQSSYQLHRGVVRNEGDLPTAEKKRRALHITEVVISDAAPAPTLVLPKMKLQCYTFKITIFFKLGL